MRHLFIFFLSLFTLFTLSLASNVFTIALDGVQVVPVSGSTATGSFVGIFSPNRTLSYTITHTLTNATVLRLLIGIKGMSGSLVVTLASTSIAAASPVTGSVQLNAASTAALIKGELYVNVHSTAYPGGAIRGQLGLSGNAFTVVVDGVQSVPASGSTATGSMVCVFDPSDSRLHYTMEHTLLNATAVHLHVGARGVYGGILAVLASTPAAAASSITGNVVLDAYWLIKGELYVNVHSTEFPEEGIRGQLLLSGNTFMVTADRMQEVPVSASTSTGSMICVFDSSYLRLYYAMTHNLADPTAFHLHAGAFGMYGPTVAVLSSTFAGSVQLNAASTAALIKGELYVNVHSTAYPGGAIRGQLGLSGKTFTVVADGMQEVPVSSSIANGTMQCVFDPTNLRLYYTLEHTVADPTLVHLHVGGKGVYGFTLAVLASTSIAAASPVTGSVQLNAASTAALIKGELYVNVHSTAYPGGAIRGQLGLSGNAFTVVVDGMQSVPASGSTATGSMACVFDFMTRVLYFTLSHDVAHPTAVLLHTGASKGFTGKAGTMLAHSPATAASPVNGAFLLDKASLHSLIVGKMYVSVHSKSMPVGAIRGQLFLAGSAIDAWLSGLDVTPQLFSSDAGYLQGIQDKTVVYYVLTHTVSNAASVGLYSGAAGMEGVLLGVLAHDASEAVSPMVGAIDVRSPLVYSGSTYVNVKSFSRPKGAIRAQIATHCSPSSEFTCLTDQKCKPLATQCNGVKDCTDNSDEWNCSLPKCEAFMCFPGFSKRMYLPVNCNQIPCTNGECCTKCTAPTAFTCHDGNCKATLARCNGVKDCADNSDEWGCAFPICTVALCVRAGKVIKAASALPLVCASLAGCNTLECCT